MGTRQTSMAEKEKRKLGLELGGTPIANHDHLVKRPQLWQIIHRLFNENLACTGIMAKIICEKHKTISSQLLPCRAPGICNNRKKRNLFVNSVGTLRFILELAEKILCRIHRGNRPIVRKILLQALELVPLPFRIEYVSVKWTQLLQQLCDTLKHASKFTDLFIRVDFRTLTSSHFDHLICSSIRPLGSLSVGIPCQYTQAWETRPHTHTHFHPTALSPPHPCFPNKNLASSPLPSDSGRFHTNAAETSFFTNCTRFGLSLWNDLKETAEAVFFDLYSLYNWPTGWRSCFLDLRDLQGIAAARLSK